MKVFIFGAGASKGSQSLVHESAVAPLANELFNTHYQQYAQAVGVGPSEIEKFRGSFSDEGLEVWLTRLWNKYHNLGSALSRKSNRAIFGRITCYIWWLMQNVSETYSAENGYKLFLEKLEEDDEGDYGFINFNYDTLLDRALIDSGFNLIDGLAGYSNSNYIKPHGSVNWFLKKRNADPIITSGEQSFDSFSRFRIVANSMYRNDPLPMNLEIFDPSHNDLKSTNIISSGKFDHQYAYPFILVPLSAKLYGHFENYKEQILLEAQRVASKATEIYLIGYQAKDEIIKDIFSNVYSKIPLHVVGKENAENIQAEVMSWQGLFTKGKIFNEGFLKFIEDY